MAIRILSRVHPGNGLWYAAALLLSLLFLFAIGLASDKIAMALPANLAQQFTWLHEFYHDARHAAGFPCH